MSIYYAKIQIQILLYNATKQTFQKIKFYIISTNLNFKYNFLASFHLLARLGTGHTTKEGVHGRVYERLDGHKYDFLDHLGQGQFIDGTLEHTVDSALF